MISVHFRMSGQNQIFLWQLTHFSSFFILLSLAESTFQFLFILATSGEKLTTSQIQLKNSDFRNLS